MERTLECSDCGAILPVDDGVDAGSSGHACPECHGTRQTVRLRFHDDVGAQLRDRLDGKVKDLSYPSKKRVRREFIHGFDKRFSKDDYVHKERLIDRDNDRYRELVIEENGDIIRDVDESLKEHFGHGSAKFKKDETRE